MKIVLRDGTGTMDLRYLVEDVDRHGNVRVYLRRNGRKTRIREAPGTDEFLAAYRFALADTQGAKATGDNLEESAPGSLKWLCQKYYNGADFLQLGDSTRRVRRRILDKICERHGNKPVARMEPRHVTQLRDERADAPEAGNSIVKALRQVFGWAIQPHVGLIKTNPARDVPYFDSANPDGFHTWTVQEVRQYENRHPVGTKARLALALLLFTGPRRSDVVRFGPPMVRNGNMCWTEFKGRKRTPKHHELLILHELQSVIDATPCGHLVFLVTEFGKPFTANGFGNWFRKRCDEAGLFHCSAHGLRKAGATIAAENWATEHQLMAIFGWESPKQAALYTKKANRKKLAGGAVHLLVPETGEQKLD